VSPAGSIFTVVNVAVLLTHYYNLFFWLAQLIFSAAFVLTDRAARQWLKGIGILTLVYGLQAAIFVGVWGRNTVAAVDRQTAGNTIESAAELRSPFGLALDSIILPNIRPPLLLMWIGGALIVIAVLRSIGRVLRRNEPRVEHLRAWVTLYLANWLMMPLVMAYVGFLVAGVARYSSRYFVFSVVPLAPLVILGVEEGVRSARGILRRRRPYPVTDENEGRRWQTWALVVSLLMICTLILPRTYAAAVAPKGDWRGTSQTIVDIIDSNPEASYAVYETSFRRIPMLDYYLARFSDDVRVSGTIQRVEERRESFAFEKDTARIGEYDYLIVPFIHHTIYDFPKAVERLKQLYEVHYWQIGPDGTGLVIFAV
jgi:hypothetical protein